MFTKNIQQEREYLNINFCIILTFKILKLYSTFFIFMVCVISLKYSLF